LPSVDPAQMHLSHYDEPGSRTRLAWLRTWLAALAVAALMLRALIISDAGWLPLACVGACLLALAAVGLVRSRRLFPRTSPSAPWQMVIATTAIVVAMATLGIAGALMSAGG